MTRDDILVLAKAGFTAAQIAALSTVQQPAPQQVQQPAPQQVQQPAPQQVQQPNFDGYMDKMDELIKTVQASNVAASRNDVRVETTDDILAAIINPPALDKGGIK